MKNIILLLVLTRILTQNLELNLTEWMYKFFKIQNKSLVSFIFNFTDPNIINSSEMSVCVSKLREIAYQVKFNPEIFQLFDYSGKEFLDVGNENECIANNFTYFLFNAVISPQKITPIKYPKNELFSFLASKYAYYGLCIKSECINLIKNIFNKEKNPVLFNEIYKFYEGNISYIMTNSTHNAIDIMDVKNWWMYKVFLIFWCFFFLYVLIRIIIQVIGNFYESKKKKTGEDKSVYEIGDNSSYSVSNFTSQENFSNTINETEKEEIHEETKTFFIEYENISKNSNDLIFPILKNERNISIETTSKRKMFHFFYEIFSFGKGFNNLYQVKSSYYNENGLHLISFFKSYSLFWIAYQQNLWVLINIPSVEIKKLKFFRSIFYCFSKYSFFFLYVWISLEALEVAYKLMNFMKKYRYTKENPEISLKLLFRFYIKCFPKVIIYLFLVWFFGIFIPCYSIFGHNVMYKFFIKNVVYCEDCFDKTLNIFLPFRAQYLDFYPIQEQKRSFKSLIKFVIIMKNIFISYHIVLLIFYLSSKIKSKIFDVSIFFIYIINFCCAFLSCRDFSSTDKQKNYYNNYMYMTNYCEIKYTHIFINIYLTGFFTGIAYFYYKDTTSTNPVQTLLIHKPFSFCYNFISFLDRSYNYIKITCIGLLFLLQLFIVFLYQFYKFYYGTIDNLNVEFPKGMSIMNFFDKNEIKIFVVTFMIQILFFTVYPNDTLLKYIYETNIFHLISRTGISFYCSIDTNVYIFYTVYHISITLSYLNICFISLGLFLMTSFFNFILVIVVEMPFKVLLKNLYLLYKVEKKSVNF